MTRSSPDSQSIKVEMTEGPSPPKKNYQQSFGQHFVKKKGLPALNLNKFKTILVSFDIGESAKKKLD